MNKNINLLIFLGLVALTLGYTAYTNRHLIAAEIDTGPAPAAAPIRAGQPAPDFSFTDITGKKHQLRDFAGKVVILNFWASWCTPCVTEFPALLRLAAAFPDDAVLLAVSSDHDAAMMDRFLARLKKENGVLATAANIVVMRDDGAAITQGLYQTTRLPETILIDPAGIMRDKYAGAVEWDGVAMKDKIAHLAGKTR